MVKPINFSTAGAVSGSYGSAGHLHSSGSTSLNHYHLDSLSTSGSTVLKDSTSRVTQASGSLRTSNSKLGYIQSSGCSSGSHCQYLEDIHSSGCSDFSHCQFSKDLKTSGCLTLDASKIEGNLICSGVANISNSTIQNCLKFSGNSLHISDSSIKEIIVNPTSDSYSWLFRFVGFFIPSFSLKEKAPEEVKAPEVILKGLKSHVQTIRFESKTPGIVFLQDGIPEPNVINGRIEKSST